MDKAEKLAYAALGRTPKMKNKISDALALIADTLKPGHSHVAFSLGKDSSVVLHLCMQIEPRIPALFCSTEQKEYLDNYNEIIYQWQERFNANICETMLTPHNWQPRKSIKEILDAPKDDVCYLGLRKSESKNRRISLSKLGLSHDYAAGGSRVCPIANWADQDVWAYIAYNDLPTLSFYDSVPKSSAKSRTSVFLGTGHSGTSIAVESRFYASKHSFHFQEWEKHNEDVVRLMRCYYELKDTTITGVECYNFLEQKGYPVSSARVNQFESLKDFRRFDLAKERFPYLSLAAWVLCCRIYGVTPDERLDEIINQLCP